jgi:hypothetical protein
MQAYSPHASCRNGTGAGARADDRLCWGSARRLCAVLRTQTACCVVAVAATVGYSRRCRTVQDDTQGGSTKSLIEHADTTNSNQFPCSRCVMHGAVPVCPARCKRAGHRLTSLRHRTAMGVRMRCEHHCRLLLCSEVLKVQASCCQQLLTHHQ